MRALLSSAVLLALAACSRAPEPLKAGSAMPPPPQAATAQSAPAASAAAAVVSAPAPAASGVRAKDADLARPLQGATEPFASDEESRGMEVDPEQASDDGDPALADFHAQQQQRDAELMQRDAEEAGAIDAAPRRDYPRAGYPQPGYPQAVDPREREDARDGAEGYDYPPEERQGGGYDDGGYDEPPPSDSGEDEYDPALDEEYDPRQDYPRR